VKIFGQIDPLGGRMRVLVSLIISAALAGAQAPQNARVEGRVVSATGEAVSKASVTLSGSAGVDLPAISTDNQGRFAFEDVPAGRYTRLTAQKAGFATQIYGARTNLALGTVLNLSPGVDLKDLLIRMTPQGVISGHVSDRDGDPVVGALMSVQFYTYGQGRRQLSPDWGGSVTNDQGDFRIANLAPGRYFLKAQARRVATTGQSRAPSQDADVTTYYPNELDETSAKALDLTEGGELRGIDIKLRKERVYSIRGKLIDQSSNSPRGNLPLTLSKVDGKWGLPFFFRARADGTFEFSNLSPGKYLIQSLPSNQAGPDAETAASVHVEVSITDGSLDALVLSVVPGYEIKGTVTLEGGDLKALLRPASSGASAGLIVIDGNSVLNLGSRTLQRLSISLATAILNSPSASAAIKEDGTFRFPGLAAGTYQLNIGGVPEGAYVKSVRLGDRDLMRGPLDLASRGGGTMSVVLSANAADLSGISRDAKGNPVSGAIVTVWPKVPNLGIASGGVKQVNADQSGTFRITGLAPGEYYAAAWDGLEPGLWQGGEFLARFNADASTIKVEESAHATLDPKLMSREKMVAERDKLP